MKKVLFFFMLISSMLAQHAMGQEESEEPVQKGFDKSRLFFGGNFGLGLGSKSSSIIFSPQVGYRFNDYFAAGAGVNLNYYSYTANGYETKTRYGYAGLNTFARLYPISYILLQVQPEINYSWGSIKYPDSTPTEKLKGQFVPSVLIGGGASIPTGGRGALILMLQYDVLLEARAPYGNKAFFSMGYNF